MDVFGFVAVAERKLSPNDFNLVFSQAFFELPQCAGIIGGRPNHALYFFGIANDKVSILKTMAILLVHSLNL